MTDFSDYIVYVDESGDHGLENIDADYPVFSLAFCIIEKNEYVSSIVPAFQNFKFRYFGHDLIVLHEHEIRKQTGQFQFLRRDQALRNKFLADLSDLMDNADFSIIASVIRKQAYAKRQKVPDSPYEVSLLFCLERLAKFLDAKKVPTDKETHIIFERRGVKEDQELELYFRRLLAGEETWGYQPTELKNRKFVPIFRHKQTNSTGLQLADLTARPIALSVLRPDQPNRAYEIIRNRLNRKVFP